MKKSILFALFFFSSLNIFPQWIQVNGIGANNIRCIEGSPDNLFAGTDTCVYRSTDGGLNWFRVQNNMPDLLIYSLCINGSNIFAGTAINAGAKGSIWLSTNNGSNWNQVSDLWPACLVTALATNGTYVFAATFNLSYNNGKIYRSSNNGLDWPLVADIYRAPFTDFSFIGNNIYVGSSQPIAGPGNLFISSDNGTNWAPTITGISGNVIQIENSSNNFYIAADGGVYRSTNNGINWDHLTNGIPSFISTAIAAQGNIVFAKINGYGLYLSTNYGTNWTLLTGSNPGSTALKISGDKIFAGTYENGLWYRPLSDFVPVELTSFTANVSLEKVELKWSTSTETNNKGFEVERKSDYNDWNTLCFVNGQGTTSEMNSYLYTDNNTRNGKYYYRLKQIDFDGKYDYSKTIEVNMIEAATYFLEQNYPNPFNPSTNIKYRISESGKVTIKVFDLLGKEAAIIMNEFKEPGIYSLSFDASKLSSGTYIYQLKCNEFVSVKKMTLLR